jgi:hypothetical protein
MLTDIFTVTCEAYIDEHQPEPASTPGDLRVVPINVSFLKIFEVLAVRVFISTTVY